MRYLGVFYRIIENKSLLEWGYMAEREGFEPSIGVKAYTPLAGERLQPTRPSLRRRHIILDLF